MQQLINLDALRALDAIDRKGSFAAAAEALYKVPSALSYTMSQLEQNLGVSLFDRSKQKARLTPAGQLLLQQGRELLKAADQLQKAVQQLDSGWEAELTLALDSVVPAEPVFALISQFLQLGKLTRVALRQEVMAGGWEALNTGRADIAIGLPATQHTGAYQLQLLGEVEFVFAVAPHHRLAQLDKVLTLADVQQETAIIVADSAIDSQKLSSGLFDSRQQVVVANLAQKITAQQQGLGVGFLPRHLVQQQLARGELIAKQHNIPRDNVKLYLAWHKQQQGNALSWFCQQLSNYPWQQVFSPS
ncbi:MULTISPECIES: LysR family transcriptional regulator [unclassified Arsukibacterium]|uniref:LysR family transcriptional regulator n=1 Tax=unclassified Arsukibacterium TaxID=2635278 RepID=UPI000C698F8C|nr:MULTISPECIES: LysR family transcriptional regulator [unclassified Arsukibacterium]MAA94599.1 LysR family transcriptional regulator [Rheinheimera sp.]MBM32818.1 LysR family transcriptional regulator [Rheinheimera sp.]|tara:strand:- start:379 stop:1287 length:909 start_codon:yes stop_codon:yes gene_type:complete